MGDLTKKAIAKVLSGHGRSEYAPGTYGGYQCKGCEAPLRTNSRSAMAEHQAEAIFESATEEALWFVRSIGDDAKQHGQYGKLFEMPEERAREWSTERPDLWEAVRKTRRIIATEWAEEVVAPGTKDSS